MTKLSDLLGRRADDSVHPPGRTESSLRELLGRLAGELVETKNQLALAKKEEAKLGRQADALSRAADDWGQRATTALRAGDDVVAKDALVRKRDYERTADDVRRARTEQGAEVVRLTTGLSNQSLRVERAKQRADGLLVRVGVVHAERLLDSVTRGAKGKGVDDLLDQLDRALAEAEKAAAVERELSDGSSRDAPGAVTESHRLETEFLVMKELAKAPKPLPKKPLAKAKNVSARAARAEASGARSSRERRTKR